MIQKKRRLILLISFIFFIHSWVLMGKAFALMPDYHTLSPVAVVSNSDFQKAFDANSEHSYSLGKRVEDIKQVYSKINELDSYPGFTKMVDPEDNYRQIGIFLVSDIDDVNKVLDILPVDNNSKVCELGSGIGNVSALFAARGADVIGYEIDQKLVWLSNNIAQTDLKGVIDPARLRFERTNFLNKDLSQFDIIFYYWNSLTSRLREDLENKLLRELKPGGLLVLYGTSKDEQYFPGLEEVSSLPGYEKIDYYTKIYTKPKIGTSDQDIRNSYFSEDLDSVDAEVRLQAALVLAENGFLDDKAYEIIREAAINKNLPLSARVRAEKFLKYADSQEFKGLLISDKQHFERIEKGDRKDFESLEFADVTLEQVQDQIKNISGIDIKSADELSLKLEKISFKNDEMARLSNGIKYFEGNWQILLREKFIREYGYEEQETDAIIAEEISEVVIFKTKDYVKAYLLCQESVSRIRDRGLVVLSGDREWFLLEAFKYILKYDYSFDQIENLLNDKWQISTAASRGREIFESLEQIGLGVEGFLSEIKLDLLANTAQQFIYRGYEDGGYLEYAAGPNYDSRGISVGLENNVGEINALHINLGVKWASKYIWASYLVLHQFINNETMNKGFYDYFYDQQIKADSQLFTGQRRVSYIGVWTESLDDIEQIVDTFVPLSIAFNSYMNSEDSDLFVIWNNFRMEFEQIILAQNDHQMEKEFFEQARMVRFVELISRNKRDNDFFRSIKKLIEKTILHVNQATTNSIINNDELLNSPQVPRPYESVIFNSI